MAMGWLAVIQAVPWGQVIDNAPKIVTAARKLWDSVSGKADSDASAELDAQAPTNPAEAELLGQRLALLEKSSAEIHEQMLRSTILIKELAEQNTQLIRHIEANRVRMKWLAALSFFAFTGAALSLLLTLSRSLG